MLRNTFIIFCFSILIVSCGKNFGTDSTTTKDAAMVEGGFNEIQKITEDALKENQPENIIDLIYGSGIVITVDPA